MKNSLINLETLTENAKKIIDFKEKGNYIKDHIVNAMEDLRKIVDKAETIVDSNTWPIPTYVDLLFSI